MRYLLLLGLTAACTRPKPVASTSSADTAWVASSALYEVFVQDFSPEGNLQGVIAGLDKIQESGANVIWLMPLHPRGIEGRKGSLGSPYASRDYRAIDSAFGTPADLKSLVDSAHGRGLKVIVDFVPNHTAMDNVWVKEHPDFYVRDSAGKLITPINNEGKPTDWTDVAELDYGNPALRRAMIETMSWWLREYDLDGFRVDVAGFVPYDFWREAVPALRAAGAAPDPAPRRVGRRGDEPGGIRPDLRLDIVCQTQAGVGQRGCLELRPAGPSGHGFASGSRRAAPLHHQPRRDRVGRATGPAVQEPGRARARPFVAMALLPGRPLLYNGQEVESPQKLGLFEREAVTWSQPAADSARDFYADVIALARTHPAILGGSFAAVETSAPEQVIAYRRDSVLVLVNARNREAKFTVTGFDLKGARSLLGAASTGGTMTLQRYGYAVLER
jgi:glycosidase